MFKISKFWQTGVKWFFLAFFLLLGGIVALAVSQGINWSTSTIKSGVHSGSLGFSSYENNQSNSPTMILWKNSLLLNGSLQMNDGTQGEGKVLMSDTSGKASWRSPASIMPTIMAHIGDGIDFYPMDMLWEHNYHYTWTNIILPTNSKYMINVSMLVSLLNLNWTYNCTLQPHQSVWLRSAFFADSQCQQSAIGDSIGNNFLISGIFQGPHIFSMLNGVITVKNESPSPKTYYYCIGDFAVMGDANCKIHSFWGRTWWENQIYAIPIN